MPRNWVRREEMPLPLGGMSAIDDVALSDEALEAWMAVKTNRRPLVRTMSALDGFVTAAVTGPRFRTDTIEQCQHLVYKPGHLEISHPPSVARLYCRGLYALR
ncbi:hypothetical protein [Mesorhizobium sp. M5C.F.Cr.IN.023.01.1.1]|uniref:hypothetical protein n=1 Tax=Mesorhizobium sp. M5C.F.Cr.IN.023.01.1.1 TaxID=2496768 RepID=UPI001FDF4397|nr:hypothetical protein [Mesorhizobium sp. M5C.F.Cr.IN.023.01.1.1]